MIELVKCALTADSLVARYLYAPRAAISARSRCKMHSSVSAIASAAKQVRRPMWGQTPLRGVDEHRQMESFADRGELLTGARFIR